METRTLYTLTRNSVWLPRRNHGKDYKAYAPLISLEAQDDCDPVELQRSESLAELQAVLNSDACRPYIDNKSGSDTLYAEMFYRYNPRAAMIGTRGGPFLCVQRIL